MHSQMNSCQNSNKDLVISLKNITKSFDNKIILKDICIDVIVDCKTN